ncbi:peptide chain release factor N(5)-glutamine methyltransferase [Meiothermus granaticius]|jgi:release factor glutamine methyltransferase|uniref:peptide chain release factor N(5)-glutamine methyltransferase n=1 Tax=Meiothermus granaticius NBRC 107808 TaxID=1227551 RepID=A0A399FC01_9DEIN|nr:peptide chain release factor N(5)-glutamine methyltransferase [Meiothermus granaticius]MCL6526829.1 peptide chain release factor N(5)-glutamine methyltransferase [Thermaceae bacterium]RIH92482.1 Release factor glutamine methyltransferase [Meiothermus granaticius NBRC 107808]GEM87179.1 release factor glutamine methyltransferase [Meiothermus granaticius NBRC 107808]
MTRLELLRQLQQRLSAAGKPGLEARFILAHILQVDPNTLASSLFQPVSPDVAEAAQAMVGVRLEGYPLQLLLGETEFFGLRLRVQKGVLIPRPETEGLVERALERLRGRTERVRVVDVGTGSGAIALALKHMRPGWEVWGTDINPQAIALAQQNALDHGLEVRFLQAAYTAGLSALDLVISNPPYLPEEYKSEAPPELEYEDEAALYSGYDGLDMARELLLQAWGALLPGGWLALELAPFNVYELREEAFYRGWEQAQVYRDLTQQPRYLLARKPGGEPDEVLVEQ